LSITKKQPEVGQTEKPLGIVVLSQCTQISEDTTMKKPNCISLTAPNRIYYLSCETKIDMDDWLYVLKNPRKLNDTNNVNWIKHQTENGREYWYNSQTGESRWEDPN